MKLLMTKLHHILNTSKYHRSGGGLPHSIKTVSSSFTCGSLSLKSGMGGRMFGY